MTKATPETIDACVQIANRYGVLEGRAFDMVSQILACSPPTAVEPVAVPFMYGIACPDGWAYFDEHCVDGDRYSLETVIEEQELEGHHVVPLYATPPASTDLREENERLRASLTDEVTVRLNAEARLQVVVDALKPQPIANEQAEILFCKITEIYHSAQAIASAPDRYDGSAQRDILAGHIVDLFYSFKAILGQADQPVAWMFEVESNHDYGPDTEFSQFEDEDFEQRAIISKTPLYTSPPADEAAQLREEVERLKEEKVKLLANYSSALRYHAEVNTENEAHTTAAEAKAEKLVEALRFAKDHAEFEDEALDIINTALAQEVKRIPARIWDDEQKAYVRNPVLDQKGGENHG